MTGDDAAAGAARAAFDAYSANIWREQPGARMAWDEATDRAKEAWTDAARAAGEVAALRAAPEDVVMRAALAMGEHWLNPTDPAAGCVCGTWGDGEACPGWDDHLAEALGKAGLLREATPSADTPPDEDVARMFHDAYERLAPTHGYSTREASAKPWSEVPERNRALMVATVHEVRTMLSRLAATPDGDEPAVETRTEWGYRWTGPKRSYVRRCLDEAEARVGAAEWPDHARVVSRRVHSGPWVLESPLAAAAQPPGEAGE